MSISVSTNVWHNSKQKGSALIVLLAMADMANDTGVCWPSVKYLADKTRMTARNVQKLLHKLQADGDLSITVGGGVRTPYGATNRYTVALKNANEGSPVGRNDVHPRDEQCDTPGVNTATPKPSLETSFEPSLETQHQTPARVSPGGGVQSNFQPVSMDSILDHAIRAEAATDADEHEPATLFPSVTGTPDTAKPEETPFVPRVSPMTTGDEPTEEETKSSGATPAIDVPEWANEINEPPEVIAKMFAEHGEALTGWYEYGKSQDSIQNKVGFALVKVRKGLLPPKAGVAYNPKGTDYITGALADFIQH